MAADSVHQLEQSLNERFVGSEVAGIRVLAASATWSSNPDADDQEIAIRLTVSDPDSEIGTWPLSAADAVRDAARAAASGAGAPSESLTVTLVPEHPDFGVDRAA